MGKSKAAAKPSRTTDRQAHEVEEAIKRILAEVDASPDRTEVKDLQGKLNRVRTRGLEALQVLARFEDQLGVSHDELEDVSPSD